MFCFVNMEFPLLDRTTDLSLAWKIKKESNYEQFKSICSCRRPGKKQRNGSRGQIENISNSSGFHGVACHLRELRQTSRRKCIVWKKENLRTQKIIELPHRRLNSRPKRVDLLKRKLSVPNDVKFGEYSERLTGGSNPRTTSGESCDDVFQILQPGLRDPLDSQEYKKNERNRINISDQNKQVHSDNNFKQIVSSFATNQINTISNRDDSFRVDLDFFSHESTVELSKQSSAYFESEEKCVFTSSESIVSAAFVDLRKNAKVITSRFFDNTTAHGYKNLFTENRGRFHR